MTVEEAKELEAKLANNILNNIPFSAAVQVLSNHATLQARQTVDNASSDELDQLKENFDKADEEARKAQEEASNEADSEAPNEEQEKTDLPDD